MGDELGWQNPLMRSPLIQSFNGTSKLGSKTCSGAKFRDLLILEFFLAQEGDKTPTFYEAKVFQKPLEVK